MMDWVDIVNKTDGIRAIYGSHVPSLDGVRLAKTDLLYHSGYVSIRFDLPELPSIMPKKWASKGADTVQLVIGFFEISDLVVQDWKVGETANIRIYLSENGKSAVVRSSVTNFEITAQELLLQKISAYQNNEGYALNCLPGGS